MKYDFDEIVPRRGTHSVKWELDSDPDILPMWVADMDFRTAPPVVEALRRRVEHGIFGYAQAPQAYYDAVVKWFERRHGWHTEPEWILHTTGVIPALSAILKALTQPGDKILVQTPVYNHFFISIRNSGCRTAENDLTYRGGAYTIDFADLERKAADPEVKAMLLCNPHNPAGRVWSPEELRRIGEICLRNGVFVVADEIHCELVMPGFRYTPFASLGEEFLHNSVTCCSPSKAFNLAGLQVANIIAAGETVRAKIEKALRINETGEIGPLAIDALIAAYDRGAEWLDALNEYLHANYLFLREYFAQHLPHCPVLPLEGTYLVWADCRAAGLASDELAERLLAEGRLRVNSGTMYGYFKDLRGQQMSFAGYANVLRHIFWNLMDGHSMVRESEKCNYTIEAWGRRCYLVQTNRETKAIDRYEILNCTYEQLRGKISKRHEAEEVPAR